VQEKGSIVKPRAHGTVLKTNLEGEVIPLYEEGGTIVIRGDI
jgi:hypothetical protein